MRDLCIDCPFKGGPEFRCLGEDGYECPYVAWKNGLTSAKLDVG